MYLSKIIWANVSSSFMKIVSIVSLVITRDYSLNLDINIIEEWMSMIKIELQTLWLIWVSLIAGFYLA